VPQVVSIEAPTTHTESQEKYYKVQVKAWTAFDPNDMELGEIAARIQLGAGVLTSVEVTRVADDLEGIDDVDVRNQFQMMIAIEQIIRNAAGLPAAIRSRLIEALADVPREQQLLQHHSER
jgi:hypothetical protein